jgi:hypothetical protein
MSADRKLSHRQELAVVALLTSKTKAEAASVVGVTSRTVERWLANDEAFLSEYRAARRRAVEGAIGQLQHTTTEAVETLRRNLICGSPSAEIRAALGVLEHAIKAVELYDLEERLAELERRAAEANGKP